jgi:DNA-binding NarL/FixJ family response regulator
MMLLLYAKARNGVSQELKQILNGRSSDVCLETYSNLDDLFQRLRQPRLNLKIGVLSIGSEAELDRLLTIRELLSDMRLVLVLSDKDPQTVSKAHALAPRFITFTDAGIDPLVSVVEKMMGCQIDPMVPPQTALQVNHR